MGKRGPQPDPTKPFSRARTTNGAGPTADQRIQLPLANELDTPALPGGVELSKTEQAMWADLWSTGPSTLWDDADLGTVAVLIKLRTKILAGTASAAELARERQCTDSLGLSPGARKALGWRSGVESASYRQEV